eukprot:GFUD01097440.1.p1 GENE.GFUD01097440.1~~GFUD01097440.1.p1  ORF type:complete len:372 (-),score=103.11 GFUD01097440.1:12-1127(-)
MNLMKTWLALLHAILVNSQVFDAEINDTEECVGSVKFNSSEDLKFYDNHDCILGLRVTTVTKEGCGCFRLHSRKNGMGRSVTLVENGHHDLTELNIVKVKSLFKITCNDEIEVEESEESILNDQTCYRIIVGSPLRRLVENITDKEKDSDKRTSNAPDQTTYKIQIKPTIVAVKEQNEPDINESAVNGNKSVTEQVTIFPVKANEEARATTESEENKHATINESEQNGPNINELTVNGDKSVTEQDTIFPVMVNEEERSTTESEEHKHFIKKESTGSSLLSETKLTEVKTEETLEIENSSERFTSANPPPFLSEKETDHEEDSDINPFSKEFLQSSITNSSASQNRMHGNPQIIIIKCIIFISILKILTAY